MNSTSQGDTNIKPALGLLEFVALMAVMTSLVALSIDAMLPAMNQIGQALGSESPQQTHLIVSLFFIGMAIGQLYYGPLADAKGRRYAILSGLLVYALGSLVCIAATSMEALLFGRVVQAFGLSGPRVASLAVIRDQYVGESMARVMSFIMMVFILVPMLAPIFGQAILLWFSWQSIFMSFLVISTAVGIWFFIRQPETLPKSKRRPFSWKQLWGSCRFILTHKQVMGYTAAMASVFGAFLTYLSASQTLFVDLYQVGEMFPLYFALLAFSIGFASFTNGKLVMRMGMRKLCKIALVGMIFCAFFFTSISIAHNGLPPLWLFVVCLFTTFFFVGLLFGNLNSMAMLPLGEMAGLGAALIGSISSVLSVPIAVFVGSFIERSVLPVALGFLVFGVLAACFVAFADISHTRASLKEACVTDSD